MGFFSWKCAKTGVSIPAPAVGLPLILSQAVMVLPDNKTVSGEYDGYGRIGGQDIYEVLAPYYFGRPATRKDVFNENKEITSPDGDVVTVTQFRYDTPLEQFGGRSLNDLAKAGYTITDDFYKMQDMIKIVRADAYNDEQYLDLSASERCPEQGYFYDEDQIREFQDLADRLLG